MKILSSGIQRKNSIWQNVENNEINKVNDTTGNAENFLKFALKSGNFHLFFIKQD